MSKVDEIIEQCNELLEDRTYFLQTIELTKEEVNVLINEIERLNNIINEFEEWLNAKYEEMHDIWYVKVLNKLKELKGVDKK